MITDAKQRQQALNPLESYIIQAPAGSGKTEILIQRILALLNTVNKPEEILALTFTRKAAGEMRARVLNALKMEDKKISSKHEKTTFMLAQKVLQKDKQLNWKLTSNPSRLQISTIDSFATGLVNQRPILSRLGSKSNIMENPQKAYQIAAINTIKLLESDTKWSDVLFQITSYFDNQFLVIQELFISMLYKREQWLPYINPSSDPDQMKSTFDTCLQEINNSYIQDVHNAISKIDLDELITLAIFASKNLTTSKISSSDISYSLSKPNYTQLEIWKFFISLIFTKNSTVRKKITSREGFPSQSSAKSSSEKHTFKEMKERMMLLIEKFSNDEQILSTLQNIDIAPPNSFSKNQWTITQNIINVLPLLVANLMLIFKEKNMIDFCELNLRSMNTLEIDDVPTDLSLALDYKIQHILIDEFQDTSNHHFKLIKKLTAEWQSNENKTIFIVGDPMQSIYRFREAEVGLFLHVQQHGINNIKLHPLTLKSNFRSTEQIVSWCNNVFGPSFPKFNDITKGAIAFSSSTAINNTSSKSSIDLHISSSNEHEASTILKLIKKQLKNSPNLKIAVIARARKNLSTLIEKLQKENIHFLAHEIDNIYQKPIIQDLLAITRAIYDVTDKIAWLAILRAPWCGLELSDLLIISKKSTDNSIYDVITSKLDGISTWGKNRIQQLLPVLEYMVNKSGRTPLHILVEEIWNSLGGPAVLKDQNDLQWVKQYINLLENHILNNNYIDLFDFEKQLTKTHITPQSNTKPLIELMTIHKSKGLEFDTVYLLGVTNIIPSPERNMLEWSEIQFTDEPSLLIAPIKGIGHEKDPIYEYLYKLSKQKDRYEIVRLMYVAATRAKHNLIISAIIDNKDEIKDFNPSKSSFIQPFWKQITENSNIFHHKHNKNNLEHFEVSPLYRLNKISTLPIKNKLTHLEESNKDLEKYDVVNKLINTNTGIIIHDILRIITENNMLRDSKYLQTISKSKLHDKLVMLGTPKTRINHSIEIIVSAIKNTISDPIGQWILDPKHINSECEAALTSYINNKLTNIVIDRMFIENNIRWIIDYKTNIQQNDLLMNLSIAKSRYGEQMSRYAKILSINEKHPIMLGIYLPVQQKWFTWKFDNEEKFKNYKIAK